LKYDRALRRYVRQCLINLAVTLTVELFISNSNHFIFVHRSFKFGEISTSDFKISC